MIHENFYLYERMSPIALRDLASELLMKAPFSAKDFDKDVASLISYTTLRMALSEGEDDFIKDFDFWCDNCNMDFVTGLEEKYSDVLSRYGLAPERYYLEHLPLAGELITTLDGWRIFSKDELINGLNIEHNSLGIGKVEEVKAIGNDTFVVINFGLNGQKYLNINHHPFKKV